MPIYQPYHHTYALSNIGTQVSPSFTQSDMQSKANMPFLPELKCAMMHLCRAFVHPSTIEALLDDPMRLLAQIESNYARLLLFLDLATSLRNDELQAQYESNQTGPSKRSLHFPPFHDDQGLAIFWMCAAVVIRELEKRRVVVKGSSECERKHRRC